MPSFVTTKTKLCKVVLHRVDDRLLLSAFAGKDESLDALDEVLTSFYSVIFEQACLDTKVDYLNDPDRPNNTMFDFITMTEAPLMLQRNGLALNFPSPCYENLKGQLLAYAEKHKELA